MDLDAILVRSYNMLDGSLTLQVKDLLVKPHASLQVAAKRTHLTLPPGKFKQGFLSTCYSDSYVCQITRVLV